MKVTACRVCGTAGLEEILDYGEVALADGFLNDASGAKDEERFPLALCVCNACGHLQIDEIVSPEALFRNYIYLTGVSDTVLEHARQLYDSVVGALGLSGKPALRIAEAASNDGTILSVFQQNGCRVLGADPARNIAQIANERGIETVAEFFNAATARMMAQRMPDADVFIARNVLAHVADLHGFVEGIGVVLAAEGIGVIEVPHALTMFDELQYDQVFHEHIGYYTVDVLKALFDMHGLKVFHVEKVSMHGGSIRVYLARKTSARPVDASVQQVSGEERARGLETAASWRLFAQRVDQQKAALLDELRRLKAQGKRTAAYGASGKGQAMLQFCGIDGDLIDYVVDKSAWKQGKLTPGTHLPVYATERLQSDKPDVLLLSAWNFADEIRRQQNDYVAGGGRMLHPLPLPHYLD
jgi:hypothetical protein